MDDRLLEFSNLLRRSGVRISPGENLDSLAAVEILGFADREVLRNTLRSTLVKRSLDVPIFEHAFDLYFGRLDSFFGASRDRAEEALGPGASSDAVLEALEKLLSEREGGISELAEEWLRGDIGRVERRVRQALDALGSGEGKAGGTAHRLAEGLGLGAALDDIELLREEALGAGLDPTVAEALRRLLEQRHRDLAALAREAAQREAEKERPGSRERLRPTPLEMKNFDYLTEDEIRQMRDAVTLLARRLRSALSTRRKRTRRGHFDLRSTLRHNLQFGGTPFRVRFRHRRKERPQILVLCDVSDSVRNASRFMLQFVYCLQDLYARVRSFIFVAEPGEVTSLFEKFDVHEAIEKALRGDIVNVYSHSDFGRAFRLFHRDHLTAVTNRTTVIVLGDARNNYNPANEWALGEIRARAKRLIWLNPESRTTWGFGDSEMERYAPECDTVEECRNLQQLYRVIDRLLIGRSRD